MDRNLRCSVLLLALGYWLALCMFAFGWAPPLPVLPLASPIYRCGRQIGSGRIWYLGALVSIVLACVPTPILQFGGLLTCLLFFSIGNLHLAVNLKNRQATILLAIGMVAFLLPGLGVAWIAGEGFGLVLLCLSAPAVRPAEGWSQ